MNSASIERNIMEFVISALYRAEDIGGAINAVLSSLGERFGVSRVYIFEDSADGTFSVNTFEWCAPGIRPEMENLQHYPYEFENGENIYRRNFNSEGNFLCADISELPEDQRAVLEPQGIRSMLQCALMDGAEFRGFIGFDECEMRMEWSAEQVQTLSTISKLVATFLMKARHAEEAAFSADFQAALDNSASYIYLIDSDSREVLNCNRAVMGLINNEDYQGKRCYELMVGRKAPCKNCPVTTLAQSGKTQTVELMRPDGMWLLAQASPMHWYGRAMVMVTCTDITKHKAASEELRVRSEENALVVRHSGMNVLRYDIKTDTVYFMGDADKLTSNATDVLPGFAKRCLAGEFIPEESMDDFKAIYFNMKSGVPDGSGDMLFRFSDGRECWLHADYSLLFGRNGEPTHAIVSFFDNTDQREKELAYEKLRNELSTLMSSSELYLEANLTRDTVDRTAGDRAVFLSFNNGGFSDLVKKHIECSVHPEELRDFQEFFSIQRLLALYAIGVYEDGFEFRFTLGGEQRWYRASIQMVRYPYSEEIKAYIVFMDVHEAHVERERMAQLASRDSMTMLLNREATERGVREALSAAKEDDVSAMFMIDLDCFKQINDVMGHQTGDRLLREISSKISEAFRKEDIVGRVGGDEFMAFLPRGASEASAVIKAGALSDALQFIVSDIMVTASIGIALTRGGEKDFDQLYAEADIALYHAKNSGKNGFYIYAEPSGGGAAPANERAMSVQMKTLLEHMDGGIVLAEVDDDVRITYLSPSFYRAMGLTEEETGKNGAGVLSLVNPADIGILKAALRRAAESGGAVDCSYRVGRRSSWHHLRAARLAEAEGGPVSIIGVVTDISDIKHSEERLGISEERYRLASELIGAMIWEVDIPTRTLFQSVETSKALGHCKGMYTNMPEGLLETGTIHPDSVDDFRRMYRDLYAGDDSEEYTILSNNDSGGYVWLRAKFRLLWDEAGRPVRSVGIVEELPNIDGEMRQFEDELRFADAVSGSMLATFRANITRDTIESYSESNEKAATGYAAMLEAVKSSIHPEDAERVFDMMAPERITEAYNAGRTWLYCEFRCERAGGAIRWTNLAVNLIRHPVNGCLFAFAYLRDVQTRHTWESFLAAPAERDSMTLLYTRETMEELVGIAMKGPAAAEGCAMTVMELIGFERFKAREGAQAAQRMLFTMGRLCRIIIEGDVIVGYLDETHLAVFRGGVDSPEDQRANVENYRGRSRMLLEQARIRVDFDMACGFAMSKGAELGFEELIRRAIIACGAAQEFPGDPVAEYYEQLKPQPAELGRGRDESRREKRRLLVVDDDEITRILLGRSLESEYDVSGAEDGEDAFNKLQSGEFSLMICDINMPRLNGWGLLERIRTSETLRELPVIILTSDSSSDSEVRALNMGAGDVVTKPFIAKTLQSRVSNMIARQEAARIAEQNRIYEMRFQQQANLIRMAEFDELSGILNKQGFFRRARERLNANGERRYMLVRWDIDNFKVVNDTMGIEVGDKLLGAVGAAMREHCSEESIYARFEADHFVSLLPEGTRTPEEIEREIKAWFAAYEFGMKLNVHIGIYYADDTTIDVGLMCDRALLALRSVKGSYSNVTAIYNDSLRNSLLEEQRLASEMAGALAAGEFELHFQPQYNYTNGELIGAEALVRWRHPEKGMLPPGKFIPLFERNGFISSLDRFVWERSCAYMRKWMDREDTVPVSISVNISRRDIYAEDLVAFITSLPDKYGLPRAMLRLEITESAYMENPEQLISVVKELQAAGFTVEMDDFGSGYSSLNTLKDVPVDLLKLDVRFLSKGEDDSRGGNILSSVIRMARWLKVPVIAEGVETAEQADYLKSLSCEYMQGYHFGKPMPAEEFERLLAANSAGEIDRFESVNTEGMSSFWDTSAQTAMIFNSLVGGAAIVEFEDGRAEIVRVNDRFFDEMRAEREAYDDRLRDLSLDFGGEDRERFLLLLEEAKGGETVRELRTAKRGEGGGSIVRLRARQLAVSGASSLIYIAVENMDRRADS